MVKKRPSRKLGIGAISPYGHFNFTTCYTHNYRGDTWLWFLRKEAGLRWALRMPQATAVVFITHAESNASTDVTALARNFDLTAAETRLLEQLARNATLAHAAKTLGISHETARTHFARIFSKTGVSRGRSVAPRRSPRAADTPKGKIRRRRRKPQCASAAVPSPVLHRA